MFEARGRQQQFLAFRWLAAWWLLRRTTFCAGTRALHAYSVYGDSNSDDCYGHGTHVAGIVGGLTFGVAKNVTLHAGGQGLSSALVSLLEKYSPLTNPGKLTPSRKIAQEANQHPVGFIVHERRERCEVCRKHFELADFVS